MASPPITPPTIAPIGAELLCPLSGVLVADVVEESRDVLEVAVEVKERLEVVSEEALDAPR